MGFVGPLASLRPPNDCFPRSGLCPPQIKCGQDRNTQLLRGFRMSFRPLPNNDPNVQMDPISIISPSSSIYLSIYLSTPLHIIPQTGRKQSTYVYTYLRTNATFVRCYFKRDQTIIKLHNGIPTVKIERLYRQV